MCEYLVGQPGTRKYRMIEPLGSSSGRISPQDPARCAVGTAGYSSLKTYQSLEMGQTLSARQSCCF